MFGTRDFLKDNYLYRYAGAKLGLYGNSKQDALYFGYFVDANHQPLDASKSNYEIHFAEGRPAADTRPSGRSRCTTARRSFL